jgi:hypothetical protein
MDRWQTDQWKKEVYAWVETQLNPLGAQLAGSGESVHLRAWSTVIRFPTNAGYFYFKAGSANQHFEAGIMKELTRAGGHLVLNPVAVNEKEGWLLLPEGGQRLREFHAGQPVSSDWVALLSRYAQFQIEIAPQAQKLIEAGVPNRMLASLPTEMADLLASSTLTQVANLGGLTKNELQQLRFSKSNFETLVEDLANIGIPASIEHGDLHDGNVFYDGKNFRIFDWGDASLSHPFISLIVPLRVLGNYLSFEPETHPQLEWARSAYLSAWQPLFSLEKIQEAWPLALQVGYIQRAMTWYKTTVSSAEINIEQAQSFVAWIRDFLYFPELPPD